MRSQKRRLAAGLPKRVSQIVPNEKELLLALERRKPILAQKIKTDPLARQRFLSAAKFLSKGKPMRLRELGAVAGVAAEGAKTREPLTHWEKPARGWHRKFLETKDKPRGVYYAGSVANKVPTIYFDKVTFANAYWFLKNAALFKQKHSVVFPTGARATVELSPGLEVSSLEYFGDAFRALVKPKNVSPEISKVLNEYRSAADYSFSVVGSLGYVAFTLVYLDKSKRHVGLLVLNRQERELKRFPHSFGRAFRNWDLEAMRIIEGEARRAGIDKILILPQLEIKLALKREQLKESEIDKILSIYSRFNTKLRRLGFSGGEARVSEPGQINEKVSLYKRATYLMKNLNPKTR